MIRGFINKQLSVIIILVLPGLILAASKKEIQAALDKCSEEKTAVESQLSDLEGRMSNLSQKNTLLEAQINDQKEEIERLKAELAQLPIEEFEALQIKITEIQDVKNSIIATLDERMELKDRALEQLSQQKTQLEQQIEVLETELTKSQVRP